MPRLFTALPLPEDIRDELMDLEAPLAGAHWIDADDYHLTLRFAGDLDNPVAREFSDNLAAIDSDAFELRLAGVGAFGGKDPRIIYAGVAPSDALDALARAHDRAARNAGIAPARRPFKPHVTLARLKYASPEAVAGFLTRYGGYRSRPFNVTRFDLMSSRPQTGGGPYAVEESFLMRGSWDAEDPAEDWL